MPPADSATPVSPDESLEPLRREYQLLHHWLLNDAYPLWATRGYDAVRGGFEETLSGSGPAQREPRRARVQVRQIFSFACAAGLGWQPAQARTLVTAGLDYFLTHYRRADGLFRTLVDADGRALDERAYLYDQAFVLLALAETEKLLQSGNRWPALAAELRAALWRHLKRPGLGFSSGVPEALPLLSNPHMHLLEAALSWSAVSDDAVWRELADEIVALARTRFIDARSGALREQFDEHWCPAPGTAGRIVEPGHQFEWAWLLLRWGRGRDGEADAAAERLVQIGETHGIRDGVAVNVLLDDFSLLDAEARLWPQTERLKAAALMARTTGELRYWSMALRAAQGLRRYLASDVPGLWFDRLKPDGQFVRQSAPASSFYHIVCAIAELGSAVASSA